MGLLIRLDLTFRWQLKQRSGLELQENSFPISLNGWNGTDAGNIHRFMFAQVPEWHILCHVMACETPGILARASVFLPKTSRPTPFLPFQHVEHQGHGMTTTVPVDRFPGIAFLPWMDFTNLLYWLHGNPCRIRNQRTLNLPLQCSK
jgi:hypothetical protein